MRVTVIWLVPLNHQLISSSKLNIICKDSQQNSVFFSGIRAAIMVHKVGHILRGCLETGVNQLCWFSRVLLEYRCNLSSNPPGYKMCINQHFLSVSVILSHFQIFSTFFAYFIHFSPFSSFFHISTRFKIEGNNKADVAPEEFPGTTSDFCKN